MNSSFKGVLFDLDGTLLDTADDLGAALNHVLKSKGLNPVSRERFRPVASDGALGLLTLGFGEKLDEYDFSQLRAQFLEFYENNIAVHTQVYSGVTELLNFLDNNDIPWGIVTNKPISLTNILLPHFKALDTSRVNIGGDSLPTRKPDPAPLNHACSFLGINNNECIYVGDAPRDIEAGNAANMYSIVALWGYILDKTVCQEWSANNLFTNPKHIIPLLK
jgi:N-acetyl-D-muramate 6-phosphate phosphatase